MSIRLLIAAAVQVVAFLFSLLGWIDPLEGGAAIVLSALAMGIAFVIGRVRIPRLTWISVASTLLLAVVIIAIVINNAPTEPTTATVANSIPPVVSALLWVYRAGSVAVMAGQAFYAIRIVAARRALTAK
jgi:hypothetical protein